MKTIPLTNSDEVALVADADFELVSQFPWGVSPGGYVRRTIPRQEHLGLKQQWQFLHVFLLGKRPGLEIDHRDGNKLNCQRENLRWATHAQNLVNVGKRHGRIRLGTSKYIGVYFKKTTRKWVAQIRGNGCSLYIGQFHDERDAAQARDVAAIKYHGEFARLNFPREEYETASASNAQTTQN